MKKWEKVLEDGYVKVKRDGMTILACVVLDGEYIDIEFLRPAFLKSNSTRLKALQVLEEK